MSKPELTTYVQYAVIDNDGDYLNWCHQDDKEDPVVGSTVAELIGELAEFCDFGEDDTIQALKDQDEETFPNGATIIREVVTQQGLTAEDLEAFAKVDADLKAAHERFEKEMAERRAAGQAPDEEEDDDEDWDEDDDDWDDDEDEEVDDDE